MRGIKLDTRVDSRAELAVPAREQHDNNRYVITYIHDGFVSVPGLCR